MAEAEGKPVRILLVDDHALFRESVARVLAAEKDFSVDHCGSLRDAFRRLAQQQFDLVLLDHDLGNERASQFLPAARESGFTGHALIVTAWINETEARRLMRQGVAGIILKHAPVANLVEAIRAVRAGQTWLDRSLAHVQEEPAKEDAAQPVFTDRQRRVLQFVVEGLSNKEIAWRLQISESYVKAILQSLFQKTGVRTRGQLVRAAFEQYEKEI